MNSFPYSKKVLICSVSKFTFFKIKAKVIIQYFDFPESELTFL